MPTIVNGLPDLHKYVIPAMRRAMCHAQDVAEIMPTILGCLLLYGDPNTLEKRGDGQTSSGNTGWMISIATGKRYAVVYNHHSGMIDVRERSQQGRTVHSFYNGTPNADIIKAFASL